MQQLSDRPSSFVFQYGAIILKFKEKLNVIY